MRLVPIALSLAQAPAAEPVDLDAAKLHLRVDGDDDDDQIEMLIAAARTHVETTCGRALLEQTWAALYAGFPCDLSPLELPYAPLISVEKIETRDASGAYVAADMNDFDVVVPSGPQAGAGLVLPKPGKAWPVPAWTGLAPVRVEFKAGYEDDAVPAPLIRAILLLVGDAYKNREAQIVGTIVADNPAVMRLLMPYRVIRV